MSGVSVVQDVLTRAAIAAAPSLPVDSVRIPGLFGDWDAAQVTDAAFGYALQRVPDRGSRGNNLEYSLKRYNEEVVSDSPLGYWRLGELTGTAAADSSGNGRTGTYVGGITLGQSGALAGNNNTAITLTPAAYVNVPNTTALNPTVTGSVEACFKTTSTNQQYIFTKGEGTFYLAMNATGTAGSVGVYIGGVSVAWLESPATYNDGNWHHVIATYDGATIRLYLDGAQVASAARSGAIFSNASDITIGLRAGGSFYWTGSLDEVALYSTALSAARVLAHYTAARSATCPIWYSSGGPNNKALFTYPSSVQTTTQTLSVTKSGAQIGWRSNHLTCCIVGWTNNMPHYGVAYSFVDAGGIGEYAHLAYPSSGSWQSWTRRRGAMSPSPTPSWTADAWKLYTWRSDQNGTEVRRNGVRFGYATAGTDTTYTPKVATKLNMFSYEPGSIVSGFDYVARAIMFDRALDDGELAALEAKLITDYAL